MTASTITKTAPTYLHVSASDTDQSEYSTRKRVGKACDSCRIKKSKCDGRKPCSRCIVDDKICTFTERKKAKEKLYSSRYVELLENRIEILQNGMAELVRRVSRGDDISGLLSKSGHVSINRALEELSNKTLGLQKEDHEHFVVVQGGHDDSEHDTEHEHDLDEFDTNMAAGDIKMKGILESQPMPQKGSLLPINTAPNEAAFVEPRSDDGATVYDMSEPSYSASADLTTDPATIIRGHNHSGPISPVSPVSVSSLYSSASPSPVELQYAALETSIDGNPAKALPQVYENYNSISLSKTVELDPMFGEADDISDVWLTSTFMEI